MEEGSVVTGGVDGTVRTWSWALDDAERMTLKPIHSLLTESCEVRESGRQGIAAASEACHQKRVR